MYPLIKTLLIFAFIGCLTAMDPNYFKRYEGFSMYRINCKNEMAIQMIKNAAQNHRENVMLVDDVQAVDHPFNVLVSPAFKSEIGDILKKHEIKYEITIDDVSLAMKKQLDYGSKVTRAKITEFNYTIYHKLDEIYDWIDYVAEKYSKIVTKFVVTNSYEGRPIVVMKISTSSNKNKPAIWFDGGIHSREWISPATVIYMTHLFLSKYEKDQVVTTLLNTFDFYILPVFNVDGYVYTHEGDRMWRKTRSLNSNSRCIGTDPNRNWNVHWCEEGASNDPCSDAYCGYKGFSEVEVKGVADYLAKINNLVCYINFHAFSQLWMIPYGYTFLKPNNYTLMMDSSAVAVNALKKLYGTEYKYDSISKIIYVASGSSVDWTYDELGIIFSYGVELRDNGTYAFLLPPDQIEQSGLETFEAVKELFLYIKDYLNLPTIDNNTTNTATRSILLYHIIILCYCMTLVMRIF